MPPPSRASRSTEGVGGRGPLGFFFGRSLRFGGGRGGLGASSSSEELSPSKGARGASASPLVPVLHLTTTRRRKGGAGRAFFAEAAFRVTGRASSDESLSRMDLAFFFFAEAGAALARCAGAGAAARVPAPPRLGRRRGASRRGAVLILRR